MVTTILVGLEPWVPVVPKYGKITTRMADFMFKELGVRLPAHVSSVMGAYLAHDMPSGTLRYEVCGDVVGWKMGEFGDAASCFESKGPLRQQMQDAGIVGLRFYNDAKKGIGRVWVGKVQDGNPVLFNSYGPSLEQFKNRLRILLPDSPMELIPLFNQGTSVGSLWINLGVGVWVGEPGQEPPPGADLGVNTTERPRVRCFNCGHEYRDAAQVMRTLDGDLVCIGCVQDYYVKDERTHYQILRRKAVSATIVCQDEYGDWGQGVRYFSSNEALHQQRRCSQCEYPVENNDTHGVSAKGKRIMLCRMCEGDKFKFYCTHCGIYIASMDEVCECGHGADERREREPYEY